MSDRDFYVCQVTMDNFSDPPRGATGAYPSRTGTDLPAPSAGWRKATGALALAAQHARQGEGSTIGKAQAFVAVKRVAAAIGLKAGDILLLDTLGAFTQPQDWQAGQRPIVWPSNAYLMEQTGFSLSALKRHARRLGQIGLVCFRDSPNGKRWGRRDASGQIVEAYGFDLSPLAARAEEFETLHQQRQIERDRAQRLRRQITVARRMIRASMDAALATGTPGPWPRLSALFQRLLDHLPDRNTSSGRLAQILSRFQRLQFHVEAAYLQPQASVTHTPRKDDPTPEMAPRGVDFDPHTQTTNKLTPVTCNDQEEGRTPMNNARPQPSGTSLSMETILQACPEFTGWVRNMGGYVRDWPDLQRIAGRLGPMIGIPDHTWMQAQRLLGPGLATAALALVFEKHANGQVASPGGYLTGMLAKAGAGQLNLERSLYGRMGARAA